MPKMTINGRTITWDDQSLIDLLETTSFVDEAGNVTEFVQDETVEEDT